MTDRSPAVGGRRAAIWAVHLLTASGAVWGLLALVAVAEGRWRTAFGWMGVALAVDMIDGTLARLAGRERSPSLDGALLDNVVDYLNYVVVPAFLLMRSGLLPESLALFGAAAICLASAYQFCQPEAKTPDHYFRGFPSLWNAVSFHLFFLGFEPSTNLVLVGLFAIAVFVPIRYVYPSRTLRNRRLTLVLTALWAVSVVTIALLDSEAPRWLIYGSPLYGVYYVAVSLYHRLSGPDAR